MISWRLAGFQPGTGIQTGAQLESYDDSAWISVSVPGGVHQALVEAGEIEDPFYDRNEDKCAWIEEKEWWYRTKLPRPELPLTDDERMLLRFDGLDTYATVYINSEEIGEHCNMFRPAEYDVTDLLRTGEDNTLAICFHRPLDNIEGFDVTHWWLGEAPRVAMRKAQFGYGWDWGPRLPTVGVWRNVHLLRQRKASITGVHFQTLHITDKVASVAVKVETDRFVDCSNLAMVTTLYNGATKLVSKTVELDANELHPQDSAYLVVHDPKLWWTHDLGEPHLYDLILQLVADDEIVDERTQQVGIRTIELDQSPDADEPGTRFFRFVLNGVPIFARGANWIPAHSFVGGIQRERYAKFLSMAQAANMNMLRVWGGGLYEHDAFYDLCDKLGIAVWQDFMFACAMYPEGPEWFVDEVAAEAEYQVRRLRSHPSMALWCGNNENQWLHERSYWQQKDPIVPGELYYKTTLPDAVATWDGQIPYWPGSPYGGNDYNSELDGDSHNWNAWHGNSPRQFGEEPTVDHTPEGVSYRRYGEDMTRFCSEFGMHAAPVLETLQRNIPEDQLYHHSPSMDHHNKDEPKNKGDSLMKGVTGLPDTLAEYIDYSMVAQAEGLKYGIEHYRRRKPHCSGTLFWQLNDCWPVLSWSVIDYYGFGKAGYYYAKRVYSTILASFKEESNSEYSLWVTNDTLETIEDELTVRLVSMDGAEHWKKVVSVAIAPNSSSPVWQGHVDVDGDSYLSVVGARIPRNRCFTVAIKDLSLPQVSIQVEADQVNEHRLDITLSSDRYAYVVRLANGVETTKYSDNFFDIEPGQSHIVSVFDTERPLSIDDFKIEAYVDQSCTVK